MTARRHAIAAALGYASVLGFASLALLGSAPDNVILRGGGKILGGTAAALAPQGWGFFTRDAREVTSSIWAQDGRNWLPLEASNGTDGRYLFGADRSARNLSVDVEWILGQTTKAKWQTCGVQSVRKCLSSSVGQVTVAARPTDNRLCGEIAVVRSLPIPWSYAPYTREHKRQAQLVEVDCALK